MKQGARNAGRGAMPLWLWMGLRMSALAVLAVALIATAMQIYLIKEDADYDRRLPEPVRSEMRQLVRHPQENADRIWQIFQKNYNIEDFLPGIPSSVYWVLTGMVFVAIPLIVVAALLASRSISAQFTSLSAAVRRVRDGDFSIAIVPAARAPREVADLTENFNEMGRRLAQYERELGESSAMLAHELRTPLNAAMGRLQAMLDDVFPLDADQLRNVHAQLEQINRLVGDLHLVSLARAGQLTLELSQFDFSALLTERLEWAALLLKHAGMDVVTTVEAPLEMFGDRDRIGQCLLILIENAVRYAAQGKRLDIAARPTGTRVAITVGDRGPGIDAADLGRIGDRFWRAEHSRSRGSGGSGLGLAIAAAICRNHGGALACRNRPGGGLEVTLDLPLRARPADRS